MIEEVGVPPIDIKRCPIGIIGIDKKSICTIIYKAYTIGNYELQLNTGMHPDTFNLFLKKKDQEPITQEEWEKIKDLTIWDK